MKCHTCNKQVPERVALWIQAPEFCTCDKDKAMTTLTEQQIKQAMKDAENQAPRPEWIQSVRRMQVTIAHLAETKRVSMVEVHALHERVWDIIGAWLDRESIWRVKGAGLHQHEGDLIYRAREIASRVTPDMKRIYTWVESVVEAAKEQGYEAPPRMWVEPGHKEAVGPDDRIAKVDVALFGYGPRPVDIDRIMQTIKELKHAAGTLRIVHEMLTAAPTREHIISSLSSLQAERDVINRNVGALNDSLGVADIVCIKPLVDLLRGEIASKDIEITRLQKVVESLNESENNDPLDHDAATRMATFKSRVSNIARCYLDAVERYKASSTALIAADALLVEKDTIIAGKDTIIAGKDIEIARLREEVTEHVEAINTLATRITQEKALSYWLALVQICKILTPDKSWTPEGLVSEVQALKMRGVEVNFAATLKLHDYTEALGLICEIVTPGLVWTPEVLVEEVKKLKDKGKADRCYHVVTEHQQMGAVSESCLSTSVDQWVRLTLSDAAKMLASYSRRAHVVTLIEAKP